MFTLIRFRSIFFQRSMSFLRSLSFFYVRRNENQTAHLLVIKAFHDTNFLHNLIAQLDFINWTLLMVSCHLEITLYIFISGNTINHQKFKKNNIKLF